VYLLPCIPSGPGLTAILSGHLLLVSIHINTSYTLTSPHSLPYSPYLKSKSDHNGWWKRKLRPFESLAELTNKGAKAIHKREVAQKKGAAAGPTSQLKANAVSPALSTATCREGC
jgi:hypothetical protein